jgi:excinuclease UvrABC helicase subunit UvrB
MTAANIQPSEIEITPDYQAVIEAIDRGDPYIFVSGKAGTGKTTLIGHLRETVSGNVVVVAPTGVAALQVRGVTIHSFFVCLHVSYFLKKTSSHCEISDYIKIFVY